MSTTLTPPPATPPETPAGPPDAPVGTSPQPAAPSSGSRAIAVLCAAAGGALILFAAGTGVISTVTSGAERTATLTASTSGVTALEVDTAAAEVEVSFASVDEATLTVTGSRGADSWELSRSGDRLVVDSDRDWWGSWSLWGDSARATLVLPDTLAGVDADLRVGAGSMRVAGEFGDLELTVDAGSIDASGTAETVGTTVSAGRASIELHGVRDAVVQLSAGRVSGALTGTAPRSVTVDAEAGGVDLTLPAARYAVSASEEAGSFSSRLLEDPASAHRVEVTVSAGSVVLNPSR
ncbi:hypothetical protein [Microbacterium oleivorans]|uniref:Adhesin domain-containing protein n=1 Tax=Microbacterium oleivorans TaxID=273677 RepID=A0A7D5ERP3_9MICO|nr:hypothetical protein [Microbacterium oleivorans]QLD11305.1 hypothetical protein HW566_05660 [Microbacterium oleivorans]